MLEARGNVADRPGDPRVDGVFRSAGRCRVVRLVEDEKAPRLQAAEPIAEGSGVGLVDEEALGDEKAGKGLPGVHAESPGAADLFQILAVEDLEGEAEAGFQLVPPLAEHRRRAGDDDGVDAAAQEKLAGNEAGFDGLPEADIVRDEQVHAGQEEGLAERFELVGIKPDAGAERRLEDPRVRGGNAVPAQGVEERGEGFPGIEALRPDGFPRLAGDDFSIELKFPDRAEVAALGIIVHAGQVHHRAVGTRCCTFDHVVTGTKVNDVTRLGGGCHGLRKL